LRIAGLVGIADGPSDRMKSLVLVGLSLAAGAVACAPPVVSAPQATAPAVTAAAAERWADSVLATLSLREKAAQIVWPTVFGDFAAEDSPQWRRVYDEIVEQGVGGYTISVGSPLEIAAKLNAMQRLARIPLLIGADLEFGAGFRARGGYFVPNAIDLGGATLFPPQMALGATRDTALAYEQGRVTAIEGRAMGIHIAYAPVLDVNNNPANPVINTRSYSEDPQLAARLGAAFIRGVQDHGMIATAKHFPGHGDTDVNSHLALPVVTASRERLEAVELVPFRAGISAGAGAIMSFHGAMPALDSSLAPGTLSPLVMTGLLRDELGFQGLAISDAMDMRGVLDRYGAADAAKRAVAAGADVLIQPVDVRETIEAVVAGVHEGRYPEARLDAAVRRVLRMKAGLGLQHNRFAALDSVRVRVGTENHLAAARAVAQRSVTLVKDSLSQIPLRSGAGTVLSITLARRADLAAGATFDAELRQRIPGLRTVFVPAEDLEGALQRAAVLADAAEVVIVSSYVGQRWDAVTAEAPGAFADFLRRLAARGRNPIVVAFGNPYLLQQAPGIPAYVVAWGPAPVAQEAAAQAILGELPFTGTLPIRIPPNVSIGAGLRR
jgi:beta-N-acetylhexosaminidase